jgi:RNA-directed DNA polymerase
VLKVIDEAFQWLCQQRRHWGANADVWDFRFHWHTEKSTLQQALRRGDFRFVPLARVTKANGEVIHLWSGQDALVLKALTFPLPTDHG